jgi:hypothetical protein
MSIIRDNIEDLRVIDTNTNDITDIKESSLSKVASNVLLSGNLALASSAVTKSNANITYTGNATSQSITTGIGSVDFTVASNGSGYYHDRVAGDCVVKNDAGTVIESGTAVVNITKNHIKSRTTAHNHYLFDGLRGQSKFLEINDTDAENTDADRLSSFDSNGISVGADTGSNTNGATYILHQTLYTHIKWGLTSQGKRYITAYNPVTREVMTMYQGSGIAGHQIPNALGIKLDFWSTKNLLDSGNWSNRSSFFDGYMNLNTTDSIHVDADTSENSENYLDVGYSAYHNDKMWNFTDDTYISYGFANSETKIITQYQGTGAAGNFIETKDVNGVAKKPRRWIIKSTNISSTSWVVWDSLRDGKIIQLDKSDQEYNNSEVSEVVNGLIASSTNNAYNASGGQYIAIVEFDTTSSNDDTYFDLPTDGTNLNVTAGKLPYTDGRDTTNGAYNVFTQSYTGSVDFSTCPDGTHYVALDSNNAPKFYEKVAIGSYDKQAADDNRLVFNTDDGKWYTTTGGELVTNGTFDSDISGWLNPFPDRGTLSWVNGMAKLDNTTGTGNMFIAQIIPMVVGDILKINITSDYTTTAPDIYLSNSDYTVFSKQFSGTNSEVTVDNTAYDRVIFNGGGVSSLVRYIDNISVYKIASTLDTALTTPISFIDDKPYQVQSGTPVYRFQTRKDRIRRSS